METLIAACGLVCSSCNAFIGTRKNDAELIRKTAEEWTKEYGVEVPAEAVWCNGCMTDGGPKCMHCAQHCEIKPCVEARHYNTCAECAEYPCKKVSFIISGVPATKTLLEALKAFH